MTVYAPTFESVRRDRHYIIVESDPSWVKRVYEEAEEYCYPVCGVFLLIALREHDVIIVEGYSRLP